MIVELVLSRPVVGVSNAEMLAAAQAAGPIFDQLPGLLTREVLLDGSGQWADLVHWDSKENAEQAMARVGQHPAVQALFKLIDEPQAEMFFLQSVQHDAPSHLALPTDHVTELALFHTAPGVSTDEMRGMAARTWGILAAQPGYLCRELLTSADGQWADMVRWRTLDDAMRAMSMMEQNANMLPFVQRIDPASVRMFHLSSAHSYA